MSGVVVATMMRSIDAGSNPARSIASRAAAAASDVVVSPACAEAKRLASMPVRVRIHSSFVSTPRRASRRASSSLVTRSPGRAEPVAAIREYMLIRTPCVEGRRRRPHAGRGGLGREVSQILHAAPQAKSSAERSAGTSRLTGGGGRRGQQKREPPQGFPSSDRFRPIREPLGLRSSSRSLRSSCVEHNHRGVRAASSREVRRTASAERRYPRGLIRPASSR